VKRVLALSTPSYWVEGKDVSTWLMTASSLMPKIFVPQGNAEMQKIADVITADTYFDWTFFRVPHSI
jgi:hypothetical protein